MRKVFKIKLEIWAFLISTILLLFAINSAWTVFIEGNKAEKNAEQVIERFDLIMLSNVPSEPQIMTESTIASSTQGQTEVTTEVTTEVATITLAVVAPQKPKLEYSPIAKINAKRIGLNVSVLSEWSYELLDISVNKFGGPDPNEEGNFIVIGHNYLNSAHFGSLHLLEIGDQMDLTDLSGRVLTYEVYEIQIIKPDELDKLMTDKAKTLTLVTCDADNQLRLVVKSKVVN